jgi:Na+/pantothenate symporter
MAELYTMIGKDVEVIANGMVYKGVLIEVSESEVHLKGLMQWITLPASSVSQIKPAGQR